MRCYAQNIYHDKDSKVVFSELVEELKGVDKYKIHFLDRQHTIDFLKESDNLEFNIKFENGKFSGVPSINFAPMPEYLKRLGTHKSIIKPANINIFDLVENLIEVDAIYLYSQSLTDELMDSVNVRTAIGFQHFNTIKFSNSTLSMYFRCFTGTAWSTRRIMYVDRTINVNSFRFLVKADKDISFITKYIPIECTCYLNNEEYFMFYFDYSMGVENFDTFYYSKQHVVDAFIQQEHYDYCISALNAALKLAKSIYKIKSDRDIQPELAKGQYTKTKYNVKFSLFPAMPTKKEIIERIFDILQQNLNSILTKQITIDELVDCIELEFDATGKEMLWLYLSTVTAGVSYGDCLAFYNSALYQLNKKYVLNALRVYSCKLDSYKHNYRFPKNVIEAGLTYGILVESTLKDDIV